MYSLYSIESRQSGNWKLQEAVQSKKSYEVGYHSNYKRNETCNNRAVLVCDDNTTPTIRGMKRSSLLDMSLSVFNFLAQCIMIAIGNTDVKISEISSITIKWLQSNLKLLVKGVPLLANMVQIIKNSGIVIIGGFVKMEIVSAILSFFSSVSGVLFLY